MGFTNKNVEAKKIEVKKAHQFEKDGKTTVFFDMTVNGVSIYGCRFVTGAKGDFIAFPSQKADNGNYYNIAWCSISEAETKDIEAQIKRLLNFE